MRCEVGQRAAESGRRAGPRRQQPTHRYGPEVLAGQSPALQQDVRGQESGGRGALHQRDGQSQRTPSPASNDPRLGRLDPGPQLPGRGVDQRAVGASPATPRRSAPRRRGLGIDPVQGSLAAGLDARAAVRTGRELPLGDRIAVHLDAPIRRALGPAGGARLEPVQHRDVVQRPEAAGAEEGRPIRRPPAESSHSRQTANGGAFRVPATRSRHSSVAERREPDTERRSAGGRRPGRPRPPRRRPSAPRRTPARPTTSVVAGHVESADAGAGPDLDAQPVQVAAQRRPERGVVVVVGYVEQQPLGRAEEVGVEHRHQLCRRRTPQAGRRSSGRTPPARDAEPRSGTGVDRGSRPRSPRRIALNVSGNRTSQQFQRRPTSTRGQIARAESSGSAPRTPMMFSGGVRGTRANESATAVAADQRVVARPATSRSSAGIGPTEQRAQVVVLPEERVEAAAHGPPEVRPSLRSPTGQAATRPPSSRRDAPAPGPRRRARPVRSRPRGRRCRAAHHDHARLCGRQPGAGRPVRDRRMPRHGSRPGRQVCPRPSPDRDGAEDPAARSPGHDGTRARNVCRMPRCQPATVRTSMSTKPARQSRSANSATESNRSTLCQR